MSQNSERQRACDRRAHAPRRHPGATGLLVAEHEDRVVFFRAFSPFGFFDSFGFDPCAPDFKQEQDTGWRPWLEHRHVTHTHAQDARSRPGVRFAVLGHQGAAEAAPLFSGPRGRFTSLTYFTQGAKLGRRKQSATRGSQQKKKLRNETKCLEDRRVLHRDTESL